MIDLNTDLWGKRDYSDVTVYFFSTHEIKLDIVVYGYPYSPGRWLIKSYPFVDCELTGYNDVDEVKAEAISLVLTELEKATNFLKSLQQG